MKQKIWGSLTKLKMFEGLFSFIFSLPKTVGKSTPKVKQAIRARVETSRPRTSLRCKKLDDGWVLTPLGVKTRRIPGVERTEYRDEKKSVEKAKIAFNNAVLDHAADLHKMWAQNDPNPILKSLSLEDITIGTSTALINAELVSLNDADVVSRSVEFGDGSPPNFHTAELSTFLHKKRVPKTDAEKYDIVVLDFMCAWSEDTKKCVEMLFRKQLFEDIAIMGITLSSRPGPKGTDYMHEIRLTALPGIQQLAAKFGYVVNHTRFMTRSGAMFHMFFKIIHPERSMSEQGGIEGPMNASVWLSEPVIQIH